MPERSNLRILIVDDEPVMRSFLKTSLSLFGNTIFESRTGRDAVQKAVDTRPDIIILDLGLPDMDGKEVIKRIRKRAKTPIIILSVRDEDVEKVAALNAGADDYLSKPFSVNELLARMRAVFRRLLPQEQDEIIHVGTIAMDIAKRRVSVGEREITLTPTEYDVLKLFLLNSGRVITHRQLLREIWNKSKDYEGILHLLRVTVSNVRNKIEPNPDRPSYLLTEPGIGYRLKSDD